MRQHASEEGRSDMGPGASVGTDIEWGGVPWRRSEQKRNMI